jgi:hypothetical protein
MYFILALSHTATFCCTAEGCDGQYFDPQDLLPGNLAVAPLPPSVTEKTNSHETLIVPHKSSHFWSSVLTNG